MRKKFYTQEEYFGISNCIFNFNCLALVVSDILGGGSQLYTKGAYAPSVYSAPKKYRVLRHEVCSRNLCVVGFREIAACSRIFGQNTKFLMILSTTTGENRFLLVLWVCNFKYFNILCVHSTHRSSRLVLCDT